MAVNKKKAKKTVNKKKSAAKKSGTIQKKSRGRIEVAKKGILKTLDQVNQVINRFEGEVEALLKKLVKQGERSRKDLKKNFDDILKKVRAGGILSRASETRDEVEKEVRRLADEVLGTFKEVENLVSPNKVADIFQKARHNFIDVVEVLVESGLVLQAKQTVLNTRKEILSFFSIPTQSDVAKLERKIIKLEKRLSKLSRKAA